MTVLRSVWAGERLFGQTGILALPIPSVVEWKCRVVWQLTLFAVLKAVMYANEDLNFTAAMDWPLARCLS